VLKIAIRNDKNGNSKNSIAINSISGYTPTLLKIASRNYKNSIAIDSISGYIPILICP